MFRAVDREKSLLNTIEGKVRCFQFLDSDAFQFILYTMYTWSLSDGRISSFPGGTTKKPRNMKVRISIDLSLRSRRKQTMACSHWRTSSAYSRRATKASLEASGKHPLGTSMYKLFFSSIVSQVRTVCCVRGYRKVIFTGWSLDNSFSSCILQGWLTESSLAFPTPLLSSIWDNTLAAWGTSGPPPRPCTQRHGHLENRSRTHTTTVIQRKRRHVTVPGAQVTGTWKMLR